MPAPIIGGFIALVQNRLGVFVTDGEITRFDAGGNPIYPDDPTVSPANWPAVQVRMPERSFHRSNSFEDQYTDQGTVELHAFSTSREASESIGDDLEALVCLRTNWASILAPPFSVTKVVVSDWDSVQEEGVRLVGSKLCYRYDLYLEVYITGTVAT